ncbi:MAG: bi-domain-containing oxidoreductase [Ignavibacteria bacterium]|nr:bi-domain-containing oxidoreductase [Ignavibacteria bacterium]
MLQILQHQKTGEILIEEVPLPFCPNNFILVRNSYSVISSGTEKASVEATKSSLLEKLKKNPQQLQVVLDNLKKEGLRSTLNKVEAKLDSYKTLGYSSSGIVVESKSPFFAPGDRVACGGAGYATHSEYVAVPHNLAAKIPKNVSFESAAFTTIGSIALQGIRQANPRIGENVAVIGLGLIGLITVGLLKANGCFVAGLDINPANFELAKSMGCSLVEISSFDKIQELLAFTNGMGYDSIIITASTNSNQPLELALKLARKKGKIVLVGSVDIKIPRSPFYEKELDFTISCSYGPGRYDNFYEEYGLDYPFAYVRWTENRNMKAFLQLVGEGRINLESLITHRFKIAEANKAYELLTEGKENPVAILIEYEERVESKKVIVPVKVNRIKTGKKKIGFIGAGSYAQFYLLPQLKALDLEFHIVSTKTPANAISVAKHFGFKFATTNSLEIIKNSEVDYVFIASRHNTHSEYVLECIKEQKPVFVEKPLSIKLDELQKIIFEYKKNPIPLMVGYNRRFSEPFVDAKKYFLNRSQPMAIHYRINAGTIPSDHWIQNPEIGGGRIIGEVCHFIDTMIFLTNAQPTFVFAEPISHSLEQVGIEDTCVITIKFDDGSVGVIEYFANGNPSLPKEYCEIFCENTSIIINNFEKMSIFNNKTIKQKKYSGMKGQKEEIQETIRAFEKNKSPIDFETIKNVSLTTFAILESIKSGKKLLLYEFAKNSINI